MPAAIEHRARLAENARPDPCAPPEPPEEPHDYTPRTCQRDPRPVHGRRAARELRTPRHADGNGRYRPGAVGGFSAAQSGKSALARPRSLRALEPSRLAAVVFVGVFQT